MIGALYPGCERGLATDILAARALDIVPQVVCSTMVAAGNGRVTDVIEVPSDSVDAQLEHTLSTRHIVAAKVGMLGSAQSAEAIFRRIGQIAPSPVVLDVKLSGPSGEDVADGRTVDALTKNFHLADLVSVGRTDAELLTSMRIESLDDAQVAVQRLEKLGARGVLLRCGRLPSRFFETEPDGDFYADLFYDGSDFSLLEAPFFRDGQIAGASSGFALAIIKNLLLKRTLIEAIQQGKMYVTEAIRHTSFGAEPTCANFFWKPA